MDNAVHVAYVRAAKLIVESNRRHPDPWSDPWSEVVFFFFGVLVGRRGKAVAGAMPCQTGLSKTAIEPRWCPQNHNPPHVSELLFDSDYCTPAHLQ